MNTHSVYKIHKPAWYHYFGVWQNEFMTREEKCPKLVEK